MRIRLVLLVIFAIALLASAQQATVPPAPAAPRHPVVDVYHGVHVSDDYRWLEDWNSPAVKQWSAAENRRTRAYLDQLPSREAIRKNFAEMSRSGSGQYYDLCQRKYLFAMKYQPPQQQPALVVMLGAGDPDSERVIIDPNRGGKPGASTIDFYVPSPDGKLVAASLSENGSEDGTAHVFEAATGKELADRVPRVNFGTGGGSIAWKADGSGFYYARYPQGNERPPADVNFYQQIYFHALGTPASEDQYILGKKFPRVAEIQLHTSEDGKWILASVANGDGGEFEHYVMNSAGKWMQVTHFKDRVVAATLGKDAGLYLLSRLNAPRGKILRLPLDGPLKLTLAREIVAQSSGEGEDDAARASIERMVATPNALYVEDTIGGPSQVRIFNHEGRQTGSIALPRFASVGQIVSAQGDDILYRVQSWLEPPAWYRYDAQGHQPVLTALVETAGVTFNDAEVVREFAVSRDGTRIPVNIIYRKGMKLDGSHPALLYGYGGFNIGLSPAFAGASVRMWLDQGGVYAVANLRGGNEYGEEWHAAGKLLRKQNVFDDFIACGNYLVEHKYTSPAHLAAIGESNGGLLMGAALTQRPDLFRAIVSYVGIYDMLRNELDPNGSFNVSEFGTVKNKADLRALYAYSPYQHVKDGVEYPAVLFLTGENDHRVNPFHSRKMTARLQAANSSGRPILLRTSASAGHGFGTSFDEEVEQWTDVFSFLFDQLGIRYRSGG